MVLSRIFQLLPLVLLLSANVAASALQPVTQIRTPAGVSARDTYNAIRRSLAAASLEKRQEYKAEVPLARSWQDASLIELGVEASRDTNKTGLDVEAGIQVICKHCYVRGNAIAALEIEDNFNISQAIDKTINDTKQEVEDFGGYIVDYLDDYFSNVTAKFSDGIDWSDFDLPTFEHDFNLSIPEIPESSIRFQFDDMELYMEIDTIINAGATYEINLFSSKSPLGFKIKELQLGFVLTLDLILSVDGEIDISSGFHLKLDDGVAMTIALFGNNVSDIQVNGGQFEFLPVTIESAGVVLAAALRVGVSCGIGIYKPDLPLLLDSLDVELDTGMEVAVYANVAEFITNITHAADDKDCALNVVQEYNFVLGAVAGASIEISAPMGNLTAAAVAEASTAVYTTTLADLCAIAKTTTTAASEAVITSGVAKREDLETTVISTEITYSGISCKVTGIANCPVTAQVSTRTVVTKLLTTAVPSGSSASFPELTLNDVGSTVPFGTAAQSIQTMSGSPTQYTAPPTGDSGTLNGTVGGVSKKLIIGISVGLGVPILLALIGGLLYVYTPATQMLMLTNCSRFMQRRRKHHGVPFATPVMLANPYADQSDQGSGEKHAKGAGVNVHEVPK